MRKHVFGHMRTAKAQISLRIRAGWSGPSLSTNTIIGYYRMYEWRVKSQVIYCACSRWSEYALGACSKALLHLIRPNFYHSQDQLFIAQLDTHLKAYQEKRLCTGRSGTCRGESRGKVKGCGFSRTNTPLPQNCNFMGTFGSVW